MAISLNNHESRIKNLEDRSYISVANVNISTNNVKEFNIGDDWSYGIVSTNTSSSQYPDHAVITTMIIKQGVKASVISHYANTLFTTTLSYNGLSQLSISSTNPFIVRRMSYILFKVYYTLKEVSHKWLSL